ncbi:MAG TPA: hypothetical protein VK066_20755 [Chloroflexota bacterium]|nr:hypothetical protein [Chloroflexota bacterium]
MERPIQVEWERGLPVPSWYEPPGIIVIDRDYWDELTEPGRDELLVREWAHHVLGAVYPGRPRGLERINALRQEERGRRLALEFLVDDARVFRDGARGVLEDRGVEAWEVAEWWDRSQAWCWDRVRLWRARYPELAALICP